MNLKISNQPHSILLLCFFVASMMSTSGARAGESLFARTYTVETVPEGHFELEQIVRNRRGRSFGAYSAYDFSTEAEYGINDAFQVSAYLNLGKMNADGAPDDDDVNGSTGFTRHNAFFQSVSFEFVYRLASPVTDPVGIALYFEPEFNFYDLHNGLKYNRSMWTEYKLLLQKDFLNDQLIVAYNLGLEIEFIRFQGQDAWSGELDWNNSIAATYRIANNFYLGLEARNHNELGDFEIHEHSAYWIGPTLHYGGPQWWATLGVLRQVYGVPNGIDGNGTFIGDNQFLRSHEKWDITAKAGIPF